MDAYDLTEMDPDARRHLRAFAELWAPYGQAMKAWADLDGGMTWKTVNGADYLARYRQDPTSGKKRFTSLGRRSAETEKALADFIARRDEAKNIVVSNRDRIATAGRVAKTYRLARVPARTASIVQSLWLRSLDRDVTVFGATALFAYELDTGVLTPPDLSDEDRLILLSRRPDLDPIQVGAAYTATVGDDAAITEERHRTIFAFPGWPAVEVWQPDYLLAQAEDERARVLGEALASPPYVGFAVSRDRHPVEMRTLDPRAYAMAALALGHDEEIWAQRAEFASLLVRERWPEPFSDDQEAAFPALCLGAEGIRM